MHSVMGSAGYQGGGYQSLEGANGQSHEEEDDPRDGHQNRLDAHLERDESHRDARSYGKKDSDLNKAHHEDLSAYGQDLDLAVNEDGYFEQRQRRRVGRPNNDGRSGDDRDNGDGYCARCKVGTTTDRRGRREQAEVV